MWKAFLQHHSLTNRLAQRKLRPSYHLLSRHYRTKSKTSTIIQNLKLTILDYQNLQIMEKCSPSTQWPLKKCHLINWSRIQKISRVSASNRRSTIPSSISSEKSHTLTSWIDIWIRKIKMKYLRISILQIKQWMIHHQSFLRGWKNYKIKKVKIKKWWISLGRRIQLEPWSSCEVLKCLMIYYN